MLEGPQVIGEAIAAGVDLLDLFGRDEGESRRLAAAASLDLQVVTDPVLAKVAGTETPRGPVAVVAIPERTRPVADRLLVAWGVGDPGNCGTLMRTAAAFGYGYVSGPDTADMWSPKVLRAAAGGHFGTEVTVADSLADLAGYKLVGTVAAGGEAPGPIGSSTAVIVGSEAHGLPEDVVAACDDLVTIPMLEGTESLNAAVAGSIVAFMGIGGSG